MLVTDIHWHIYRIPFVHNFTTAHGVMAAREGAIIEIKTDSDITGSGEMAPLPEFGGPGLGEACVLLAQLTTQVQGKPLDEALDAVYAQMEHTSNSAICGLEMALLDVAGQATGRSLSRLLSSNESVLRPAIPVNAVVGAREMEAAIAAAQEAISKGYSCVKLKVGVCESQREEIERIAAVRQTIGPSIRLRLDANEVWDFEQAVAILSRCTHYEIEYIEQPLKKHDLQGMHALRRAVPVPIAADEAVYDLASARHILDSEAADVLVIKPQLAGGLRASQRIMHEAAERGVESVVTTTIESGISLAATLHLAAASPIVTRACGLATSHLLADDLIVDQLAICNGLLGMPTGPGLGVVLDRSALDIYK